MHGRERRREVAPNLRCTSTASSVISSKKSARQYHCRPAGTAGRRQTAAPSRASAPARPAAASRTRGPAPARRRPGRAGRCSTRRCRRPSVPKAPRGTAAPAGTSARPNHPLRSSGSDGSRSRYQRSTSRRVGDVVEHRPADDHAVLADRVAAEREGRDHAEVAAAAAQRPEQVGVGRLRWPSRRCRRRGPRRRRRRLSMVRPKRRVR